MRNSHTYITRSRIAVSVVALGTFITTVSLRADENGPDRMATRANISEHVIRGLPHNGAPAGGAVVTGNGINYNGGPVMHPVNLYFILYGNWSNLDSTGPALLEKWAQNIAPSPYFNINTTYGDSTGASVPNLVTFEGTYTDTGTLGNSLSDASIATLASNAINHGFAGSPNTPGNADPNGVYMVLTAPGVAETSGFLTQYCGWHWSGSFINGAITPGTIYSGYPVAKFAFIGDAAGPSLGNCAAQSKSPNNDAGADAMISVMAHELSEASTDPEGNAWYASNGEENGDLCAWNFGTTFTAPNGSAANVTLNGTNYLMQQIWLNAQGGKCALSYASTPDFSVSVSGSQTVAPGGTSGNYTLTATPSNGFSGTVNWTVTPPSGISASTPVPVNGSPNNATFTLTAASTLGAGTYSIPITGTSGSLTHSVNATLVVAAPVSTFSLSIVPGSQTVTRPSSGTTTITYVVDVTAVNGFTNKVTLSASGQTTGVTTSITGTNPVAPGGTGTLSVAVTNRARKGTRTLTVTGSATGTSNKSATVTITIN